MKTSRADYYFSLFIRHRDRKCVRCGNHNLDKDPFGYALKRLQNSHFYGRTIMRVRFDEENCDALCHGCHRYWEKEDRVAYQRFKYEQLGKRGLELLEFRAHNAPMPNELFIAIYYYHKLKELKHPVPKNEKFESIKLSVK